MLHKVLKSYRARQRFALHEGQILVSKVLSMVPCEDPLVKRYLLSETQMFLNARDSSTRLNSVCVITGRTRGVYRDFRMNRMMIRKEAGQGEIPGLRKASW
jgi:small subunit ribosomal protein S14